MQIFSKIDIGKMRTSNQDAYYSVKLSDNSAIILVCDGMGGANAGNVASETAIKLIADYILKSYRPAMNSQDIEKVLCNAISSANLELFDMAKNNEEYNGMGTTLVAAHIKGNDAVICNVGDSRAYLINDKITQITRDHSVVQSLIESGKLSIEDAKVHPRKNVITRALGAEENVIPDVFERTIENGEYLLFCTDGLSNFVESQVILDTVKNSKTENIAEILVNKANSNGGGDNITVVLVAIDD